MQLTEINPVRLSRVNPALNMARFYEIDLQPNLFGEMSVLRSWGRIGTKGQVMMVTYPGAQEAVAAAGKLEKQKWRRGYRSDAVDPDIGFGYGAPMEYQKMKAR